MNHYWWLCYQAWDRSNALLDVWRYNSPSWILQRQVTEAQSGVAPMRNWGFVHICSQKNISALTSFSQPTKHVSLQTKNNACRLYKSFAGAHSLQALKWHLSSLQQAVIRLTYNCNISQVPKYSIWLRLQEWRREQQTFVPNLKLHYTNCKNLWPSIINMETLLLLFTTRSALINIQAECPDLRRI